MGQMFSEVFVPQSKFDPVRDIPDLSGKVMIVTGQSIHDHYLADLILAPIVLRRRQQWHRKGNCQSECTGWRSPFLWTDPNGLQHLLLKNAKVYMGSRSKSRAETAIAEVILPRRGPKIWRSRLRSQLRNETGREAIFLELDLASLDSVAKAATEFKRYIWLCRLHFEQFNLTNRPFEP